jgi:protein XRP2
MGNCDSADLDEQPVETPVEPPKKTVPRENLVQVKLKDTELRRGPGDIAGNQFQVDELTNCKVIVTDVCDSMMIDRCVNCELILSAVRGSIFVRDCENSKFHLVCGQFRCRSCTNCHFFMHVKTGPVIESSKDLVIGCSDLFYPELLDQMSQAGLDPVTNCWTDIHDFTPGPGHFEYNSGVKLDLSIMDRSGIALPFTRIPSGTRSTFKFRIPGEQIAGLAEVSQRDEVHLVGIVRDNGLVCSFEADSRDTVESLLTDLGGASLN